MTENDVRPRTPTAVKATYLAGVSVASVISPLLHISGPLLWVVVLAATVAVAEMWRKNSPTSLFRKPRAETSDGGSLCGWCLVILALGGLATLPLRGPTVRHGVGLYVYLAFAAADLAFGLGIVIEARRQARRRTVTAIDGLH